LGGGGNVRRWEFVVVAPMAGSGVAGIAREGATAAVYSVGSMQGRVRLLHDAIRRGEKGGPAVARAEGRRTGARHVRNACFPKRGVLGRGG
jgi:hypothetical protein